MLVAVQCSGYKQARVLDAAFHHSIWRPAAHGGAQSRSEALFYYFRPEDQVPENHLLRLIDPMSTLDLYTLEEIILVWQRGPGPAK
jgi:hypothetical protein